MIWLVALGSAIGGVLRYLLSPLFQRGFAEGFPGGTLIVNILGSFVIGLVLRAASESTALTPEARVFLTVGVCGGFTTFSAFSAETLRLLQTDQWSRALIYITASIVLSVGAAALGWLGGGLVSRPPA